MPASPFHLSTLASFFLLSLLPTEAEAQVQALFIFGDSVVDCGNNDYLPGSTATADFLPYGIDLPAVTSRFTNARTVADILGELLGIEHFVACSRDPNTRGQRILNGVNYASAGTGILEWTGRGVSNCPHKHTCGSTPWQKLQIKEVYKLTHHATHKLTQLFAYNEMLKTRLIFSLVFEILLKGVADDPTKPSFSRQW
ncbi:hypothetical protein EJ110_NYTH15761 [Nymphaea thermarum]|nr:hypothetical protein EJ110_NYTH15761 [Nymphaea thermarum]